MMLQICWSHQASSYQRSGVHACLAGQEMGQIVQNVKTLWFALSRRRCDFSFSIRLRWFVTASGPQMGESYHWIQLSTKENTFSVGRNAPHCTPCPESATSAKGSKSLRARNGTCKSPTWNLIFWLSEVVRKGSMIHVLHWCSDPVGLIVSRTCWRHRICFWSFTFLNILNFLLWSVVLIAVVSAS